MAPEKMVRMANQIATFFKTQPGSDPADKVASHLSDFWGPDMRGQLRAHVASGGEGLDPVVIAAANRLN